MTALIACSRMYNISPQVTAAWDQVFATVGVRAGVAFDVIYHAFPSPIEELWALPGLGCVLMCGYPYIRATPRPQLLAAPVPSSGQYKNQPVYFSHLLVAEDSPFQTIEDTFDHRISWTIENSQSGYNAVRSYLLPYRTAERPRLYRESIGPLGTFSVGVEGLRRNEIDVVPIDSFSYDLMLRDTPEALAGTRVLATTPATPFPPLIAGHDIDPEIVDRIREALLDIDTVPGLRSHLDTMLIRKFVAVSPEHYEPLLQQEAAAIAAGYPRPE